MAKEKNQVAIVSTPTSERIAKVEKELSKLQAIRDSKWKTNGNWPENTKNLKDITDISELITIGCGMAARTKAYNDYAENVLGLKNYKPFTVEGGTSEDWDADIKLRMEIINHKAIYDKLTKIKAGYRELMDKDDKLALLDKELEELGD